MIVGKTATSNDYLRGPIKFIFNHGASFAFYFDDPDGNMVEVYWPTGDLRLK